MAPRAASAQTFVIDNNTTFTEAAGPVTRDSVIAGNTSGTVGGVPGGTYIVPIGSEVTLSTSLWAMADLTVARFLGSSGLVEVEGTILLKLLAIGGGWGTGEPGGIGRVEVKGGTIASTDRNSAYMIGLLGDGTLVVSNGGTVVNAGGTGVGQLDGSRGELTVDGPGSTYTTRLLALGALGAPGQLNVIDGGFVSVAPEFGGYLLFNNGTAMIRGTDSRLSVGTYIELGLGPSANVLTVAEGGTIEAGDGINLAETSGSTDTFNIGAAAGDPPAAPGTVTTRLVTFYGPGIGDIVFNHTDTSGHYVFTPIIIRGSATTSAVDVYNGTTVMTPITDPYSIFTTSYFGPTTVHTGTTTVSTLAAGAENAFSPNSDYVVQTSGVLDLQGHDQTVLSLTNAGLVRMAVADGAPGTVLTVGNCVGQGGMILMDTFLGGDDSPSDMLVLDGGTATGTTLLHILNVEGPGAPTVARGIQVVQDINGGSSAPGAFALAAPAFAGGFGYTLEQEDDGNWYLRSHARGTTTCTQDRTYWQTHSSQGPDPMDPAWSAYENAPFFMSGQTYFDVISTNSGNPYDMLGVQYITAILNGTAGVDLTVADPTITQASTLFAQYTPAEVDAMPLDSPIRDEFMQAAQTLALFNEGALGPVSCTRCCDAGPCDGGDDGGSDGGKDGGITMGDPGAGSNGTDSPSASGGCSAGGTGSHGAAFPLGLGSMLALLFAARRTRRAAG